MCLLLFCFSCERLNSATTCIVVDWVYIFDCNRWSRLPLSAFSSFFFSASWTFGMLWDALIAGKFKWCSSFRLRWRIAFQSCAQVERECLFCHTLTQKKCTCCVCIWCAFIILAVDFITDAAAMNNKNTIHRTSIKKYVPFNKHNATLSFRCVHGSRAIFCLLAACFNAVFHLVSWPFVVTIVRALIYQL